MYAGCDQGIHRGLVDGVGEQRHSVVDLDVVESSVKLVRLRRPRPVRRYSFPDSSGSQRYSAELATGLSTGYVPLGISSPASSRWS